MTIFLCVLGYLAAGWLTLVVFGYREKERAIRYGIAAFWPLLWFVFLVKIFDLSAVYAALKIRQKGKAR